MPRSPASEPLTLCPSPVHRGVLGLFAVAMGRKRPGTLIHDLRASDELTFARIANSQHVHPVLATAFDRDPELEAALPADLVLYFREMQRANVERHAMGRAQLGEIGAVLRGAGIAAVVLKGGADILAPLLEHPAHRNVGDLDILVPEGSIDTAFDLVADLGGWVWPHQWAPGEHHHHPVITADRWGFPVEMHLRSGIPVVEEIAPASEVLAQAEQTDVPGMSVPSLAHRALLHVAHLQSERYDGHILYLRGILDHHAVRKALGPDAVAELVAGLGEEARRWWDSLDELTDLVLSDDPAPAGPWSARALRLFGDPRARRLQHLRATAAGFLGRLTSPQHLKRYAATLVSPRKLKAMIDDHRNQIDRIR